MVKGRYPKRFEVYWINLDPTVSAEVKKTKPCVIISPDSMNQGLQTVLVAPMTTTKKNWPFRILVSHKGTEGQIMLDQVRTISKKRLAKTDGKIPVKTQNSILECLGNMFAQ